MAFVAISFQLFDVTRLTLIASSFSSSRLGTPFVLPNSGLAPVAAVGRDSLLAALMVQIISFFER